MADVFVCLNPSNKMSQTLALKKNEVDFLTVLDLAVQNQGVGGAGFSEATAS